MRGTSFRWAVAASAGLHVVLAAALLLIARPREQPAPERLDTAVPDIAVTFAAPDEKPATVVTQPPPPEEPRHPKHEEVLDPRPPLVRTTPVPATLPPELVGIMRRPGPVGAAVVEVPITIGPGAEAPGTVRPAAATVPAVPPVHGALGAGQSIVYVLDASGSMGAAGKFAAARRAVLATLKAQPEAVRVQVVVYAGTARAVLPGRRCVPATADAVARIDRALAEAEPAGRSDHAAGLRAALELRPDFVLLVTDADDLSAARLRGVVARAEKPAAVCVAAVSATGVGEPRELR